jgi:hypothetical protein
MSTKVKPLKYYLLQSFDFAVVPRAKQIVLDTNKLHDLLNLHGTANPYPAMKLLKDHYGTMEKLREVEDSTHAILQLPRGQSLKTFYDWPFVLVYQHETTQLFFKAWFFRIME